VFRAACWKASLPPPTELHNHDPPCLPRWWCYPSRATGPGRVTYMGGGDYDGDEPLWLWDQRLTNSPAVHGSARGARQLTSAYLRRRGRGHRGSVATDSQRRRGSLRLPAAVAEAAAAGRLPAAVVVAVEFGEPCEWL
jgi:hypothetical protein